MEGKNMTRKLPRLLASAAALSLVAAACGSDGPSVDDATDAAEEVVDDAEEAVDDATDAAEEAVDDATDAAEEVVDDAEEAVDDAEEAVDDATDAADDAVEDAVAAAGSIEELEAQWAEARAAIVADIKANGYGVTDGIVNGPGGFTMDLNDCPADWNDLGGINDGVVTIGHTTAQSGSLAFYGNIGVGMGAYFEYVNGLGGVGPDGLQLELLIKDDAYTPSLTQELVGELLQTEDPFYITTLGSPNTFSVQGELNDKCIPQPFSMTGHQAWGDPENFPWTSGLQMSYATESLLWGNYIEQNFEPGVKVAALVMDNDFGLAYEQGFADFAENSDIIGDVQFVRHDPAAATLTNEITTLASGNPDVFIAMTAGNPCLLATQEAARAGITTSATAFFEPSVCKAVSSVMGPAGEAAEGWLIFGGGWKDNTDPQYADDVFISWMNDKLDEGGLDSGISLYATGFGQFGWTHVETMRIAAELDGGLTRSNFMIASRALRLNHPALLEGIGFGVNGAEDAFMVEGSDLSRFDATNQSWIIEGDVIDLDGQSPNCAWVPGEGC